MDVFVCSNPKCRDVHAADPKGHCPTCITADGVGFSTRPVDAVAEIKQLRNTLAKALVDGFDD